MSQVLQKLRRLGYASVALQGLVSAVAPKLGIAVGRRLLGLNFDGTEELTPKPWYVRQTRAVGVGMLAMGLAGLLLEGDEEPADSLAIDDERETAEDDTQTETAEDDTQAED